MELNQIAELFTALRGGVIKDLNQEGDTLRFRINFQELASSQDPEFSFFYAAVLGCKSFSLQPFRNESTVIHDLKQIDQLSPEIKEGSVDQNRIKVFCAHKGVSSGARISIRCDRFEVYNESFDMLDATTLAAMRLGDDESEEA